MKSVGMESTIGQRLSINDCCHLEIDRGRYLSIDDDGEYFISAIPQLIRGIPIEGPQTPTVFEGAKPGNRTFRFFVVDRGEALDLVLIGTLLVYDCWIWVAGTAIRNENGEEDDDEFEEYLPIMVQRYPKEMPPNMSVKEVMAEVKRQSFLKLFADMKKAGIEPPDFEGYDLVVDPHTLTMGLLRKPKRKFAHVCRFRNPLMASIGGEARKKKRCV